MTFLDTNVLVYLFDHDAPAKRARARGLFDALAAAGTLQLSTQVMQEFYVTVTRKLGRPLAADQALAILERLTEFHVVQIDARLTVDAARRQASDRVSYWDALIVEAALRGGATTLLSEDLQHGRAFGGLRVENPFA